MKTQADIGGMLFDCVLPKLEGHKEGDSPVPLCYFKGEEA
jgi:hypothetical protein